MAGRKPKYPCVQYSETERKLISKAKSRGALNKIPENPKMVEYRQSGNFTKCVIAGKDRIMFGVAKRNPEDRANPQVANSIAFYRAITSEPMLI